MMLSRRAFLFSASAMAVAAAMPLPGAAAPVAMGVDLSTKSDMLSFAVGTPGEYDWQFFRAATPEDAFQQWVWSRWGDDEDARAFDPEFVNRVEQWDALEAIRPADWFAADMGHCCERCGYETHADAGGRVVAGDVVCEECLTLADRIQVEPESVVEDVANEIAENGEAETLAWVERQGATIPDDLWQRAVKDAQA